MTQQGIGSGSSQEIQRHLFGQGTDAELEFIVRTERAHKAVEDYNLLRELLEQAGHEAHAHDLEDVENAVIDALGWVDTAEARIP